MRKEKTIQNDIDQKKPSSGYAFNLVSSNTASGVVQYSDWLSCDGLIFVEAAASGDHCYQLMVHANRKLKSVSSIRASYDHANRPRSVHVTPASAYGLSVEELDEYIQQLTTARYAAETIQRMFIDNWEETAKRILFPNDTVEVHHE